MIQNLLFRTSRSFLYFNITGDTENLYEYFYVGYSTEEEERKSALREDLKSTCIYKSMYYKIRSF